MHPTSLSTKQNILALIQQGLSSRQIALQCNTSYKTVQRLCKTHYPDIDLLYGGRPQKLSSQNKHYCIRAVTSGKLKTAIEAQQELENNLDIKVDESTICRILKDAGLEAMKKEKRPKLSTKNIK